MEIKQSAFGNKSPFDCANLAEWEKRSQIFGTDPKGVLFKGLPDIFNEHIHNWQLKGILAEIGINTEEIRILDIGCGYGRISLPVLQTFPRAKITGIDISQNYVDLFRQNTGQDAFVSFVEDIGSDLGLFDYIVCVTVLMYTSDDNLENTFKNILNNLKKKGKLLLIEPSSSGTPFQTCFGLLSLLKINNKSAATGTGGNSFKYTSLRNIIINSGAKILKEYRLPATTLFFLFIYVFTRILPVPGRFLLHMISKMDEFLKFTKLPSMYVFYVIEK